MGQNLTLYWLLKVYPTVDPENLSHSATDVKYGQAIPPKSVTDTPTGSSKPSAESSFISKIQKFNLYSFITVKKPRVIYIYV